MTVRFRTILAVSCTLAGLGFLYNFSKVTFRSTPKKIDIEVVYMPSKNDSKDLQIKRAYQRPDDSYFYTTRPTRRRQHQNEEGYKKRLPQVLGIGVKKCGTTALIRFLSLHPNIVIPSQPEMHFFDMSYKRGLEFYRSRMPYTTENEITLEKSPRYFVLPDVPMKVKQMSSKTKILLVVCDPVKRAYSDYSFERKRNNHHMKAPTVKHEPDNFNDFVTSVLDQLSRMKGYPASSVFQNFVLKSWNPMTYYLTILNTGLYSIYLKNWLKYFPLEQIMVINGDELLNDPVSVLERTQKFLGLEVKVTDQDLYFDEKKGYYCIRPRKGMQTIQCLSPAKGTTRNKTIDEMMNSKTLNSLREFYGRYNKELFSIIGQNFEWT